MLFASLPQCQNKIIQTEQKGFGTQIIAVELSKKINHDFLTLSKYRNFMYTMHQSEIISLGKVTTLTRIDQIF